MRYVVFGLLAGILSAQQPRSSDTILARMERHGAGNITAGELNAFSAAVTAEAKYGNALGPVTYRRQSERAARSLALLSAIRQQPRNDLRLPLARAYRSVALLQETGADPRWANTSGALLSYQNAYLLLNQVAEDDPDDPQVRGYLMSVRTRVRALGGTVDLWTPLPAERDPPAGSSYGVPDQTSPPPQKGAPVTFELPKIDWAAVPEDQRGKCQDVLERYVGTVASAQGALSVLDNLRGSVESRGLNLRADYEASAVRIKLRLDSARQQLDRGDCGRAEGNLSMAEGETSKLLRNFGQ